MHGVLVALDLETTGLDIQNDSIIEIGAVKIKDGQIIDEYTQLVNPGFEIPAETSRITGIYQDDLRSAPMLPQVLPNIREFVGNMPIIAHNVSFDIGFMHRFGSFKDNLPIDTVELSSILLPRMARYNLGILTSTLGIQLENAHRALDDARATALLYWHLWDVACALPHALIYEIHHHAQQIDWELKHFFADVYQQQLTTNRSQDISPRIYFATQTHKHIPLQAHDTTEPIDEDFIDEVLGHAGKLANQLSSYEERPQQIAMSKHVAEAFNNHKQIILEAGTGTGKSLAYLIPAVEWASRNQERVVIATNTINLQDQLLSHDIPTVIQSTGHDTKAVTMKGRSHYLCPRRLDTIRRRGPANVDELRTLAKILIWLEDSEDGDKSQITLRGAEYFIWSRLSAQDEGCTTQRCTSEMHGVCPFYRARRATEEAHIIIINHALLVSDIISQNRVLPDYKHLIIDEAHQLEDAVTSGLSLQLDQTALLRRLNELGSPNSGIMGDLLARIRTELSAKKLLKLESFMQNIASSLQEMGHLIRQYFTHIYQFLEDTNNMRQYQVRINDALRSRPQFMPVKDTWHTLNEYFEIITESLGHLVAYMDRLQDDISVSYTDSINSLSAAAQYLATSRKTLYEFTSDPSDNQVYWVSGHDNITRLTLHSAPIHVGQMLEDYIWQSKQTVILTSATLRTDTGFDYLNDRLYADNMERQILGSPFDYKKSTLLFVPTDMPLPNESGYQSMVERGIIELAAALDGRVMVLFTSYGQLRETAANIAPRLALGGIDVYDQATGGSRESLLKQFKENEKAVLLGTRSFWQGIDIPGDDLSALVIARLPFAVPSDPIFSARSQHYEDAFKQFAVPDAILRFRQGFGRLIRTNSDKGIIAIFDARVTKKQYGEQFLHALPDCERQDGKISDLAHIAKTWLADKQFADE